MGTVVTLLTPADAPAGRARSALRRLREIFEREDRRFSRFRPDSELTRVNEAAGRWTRVSAPFAEVLGEALRAAKRTKGLFDPTVLPALIAAGYDRDFDELIAGARDVLNPPRACAAWADVALSGSSVRVPSGAALDFGGIAKGWTVDLSAGALDGLFRWALVDAGGDMRIVGTPPAGGLQVAVEDPFDATSEILRLRLRSGGLATSSIVRRSWGPGLHHLIDPRTGRPADTGVLQATVWRPTCTSAEVWAKAALLSGVEALDTVDAVLVMESGEVHAGLPVLPEHQAAAGW